MRHFNVTDRSAVAVDVTTHWRSIAIRRRCKREVDFVSVYWRHLIGSAMLWAVVQTPAFAGPQDDPSTDRTAQVRHASKDVMPFSMEATQHRFRKTDTGGVQTVVARDPDVGQTKVIREHLRRIAEQFSARDFSGPAHVHGQSMPGLSEMRASKPGELDVAYAEVPDGGTVTYVAHTRPLVDAVHRWFDAQVSDHGADARAQ